MNQQAPTIFTPQAGQTEWWEGNPEKIPLVSLSARHPSIIARPNTISREQCKVLIDCFERNRAEHGAQSGNEFWDGRFIWQNSLPESEVEALRIMQQIRLIAQVTLMQEIALPHPLYSDTAQIVLWTEGYELRPHTDNLEPDGRPNTTPHRICSSLLYLNDEYEGGETYFPGHNVRVQPDPGLLVLFGSGPDYVHGVTKVRSGRRYVYAGWFTFNPKQEDPNAKRIF